MEQWSIRSQDNFDLICNYFYILKDTMIVRLPYWNLTPQCSFVFHSDPQLAEIVTELKCIDLKSKYIPDGEISWKVFSEQVYLQITISNFQMGFYTNQFEACKSISRLSSCLIYGYLSKLKTLPRDAEASFIGIAGAMAGIESGMPNSEFIPETTRNFIRKYAQVGRPGSSASARVVGWKGVSIELS